MIEEPRLRRAPAAPPPAGGLRGSPSRDRRPTPTRSVGRAYVPPGGRSIDDIVQRRGSSSLEYRTAASPVAQPRGHAPGASTDVIPAIGNEHDHGHGHGHERGHGHGHGDEGGRGSGLDVAQVLERGAASPLLARLLTIGGGIGLLAALVRAGEKIGLFGGRSVEFCGVGAGLGCDPDVLASLNPLLGVAGFAMLTAVGVVLSTGVALTRGLWLGLQAAVTFGVVFVHGLVLRNASLLDTTCSYCLLACAVLIPLFWYTTVHTVRRGWLPVAAPLHGLVQTLVRHRHMVLIVWYLLVTGLVYVAG